MTATRPALHRSRAATWRQVLLMLVIAAAAGCTNMAYAPSPADFPPVRIVEHRLPNAAFKDECADAVGTGHHVATGVAAILLGATIPLAAAAALAGPSVDACAKLDFRAGVCNVYFSADFPPSDAIVRHEREQRCTGHDNPGDRALRDAWEAHKLYQRDAALWENFHAQRASRDW